MRITGYGDGSEYLSFTLSIIIRRGGHERTSLPINHVCVSGEGDPSTIFGIEEETVKENQHVIYLKLRKEVSGHFLSPGEDAKVQNNAAQRMQRKEEAYHLIELGIPRYGKSR